jgi:synaptobrevin homolog YKT6
MRFLAFTVAERTQPGIRQNVTEKGSCCFAYGTSVGVVAVVIATDNYPSMAAHGLLSKMVDEFTTRNPQSSYMDLKSDPNDPDKQLISYPGLAGYIEQYQDPNQLDSLSRAQQEIDDTKKILQKTIESVLERGEKIDNLVAKSDGLSASSKMFYQQAKKQNSCCVVM